MLVLFLLLCYLQWITFCEWMVNKEGSDLFIKDDYFEHPGEKQSFIRFKKFPSTNNTYYYGGRQYDSGWIFTNDLWQYNMLNMTWTLITGDTSLRDVPAVYSTKFLFGAGSSLGGRYRGAGWIKKDGSQIYIFGGSIGGPGMTVRKGDIWTYSFSQGWAWLGGLTSEDEIGNYPTIGTCGDQSDTFPGTKIDSLNWIDFNDDHKLWFYGGQESDDVTSDLWHYDTSIDQFCYISGHHSNLGQITPIHHQKGYSGLNDPGSRKGSATWTYQKNALECELCFFGGTGDFYTSEDHAHNDVMCWSTQISQWNWKSGSSLTGINGKYSEYWSTNAVPGGRIFPGSTFLHNEYLFIFGGLGFAIEHCANHLHSFNALEYTCLGTLSDMWIYNHITSQWKYISGLDSNGNIDSYISLNARDVASWNYNDTEYYAITNYPESKFYFLMDNNNTHIMMHGGLTNSREFSTEYSRWQWYVWTYEIPLNVYDIQNNIPSCNNIKANNSNVCSGNGRCNNNNNNECECIIGYSGNDCEYLNCFNKILSEQPCNSPHGTCVKYDECNCNEYYTGIECEIYLSNNHTIRCISRCDEILSQESDMTISYNGPFENDGLNFIGSRIKSNVFSYNQKIFIFGGGNGGCTIDVCDSGYFNDFWIFDVKSGKYTALEGIGTDPRDGMDLPGIYPSVVPSTYQKGIYPSARASSFSNEDPSNVGKGIFFLFGGKNPSWIPYGDLWSFNAETEMWKLWNGTNSITTPIYHHEHGRPSGRQDHAIWYIESIVYIFSGVQLNDEGDSLTDENSDLWYFDTTKQTGQWILIDDPRYSSTPSGGIYIQECLNRYNCSLGSAWPARRNGMLFWNAKSDIGGYELWIFGGISPGEHFYQDLFSYSIQMRKWKWSGGVQQGISYEYYNSYVINPNDYHKGNWPSGRGFGASYSVFDYKTKDYFTFLFGGNGLDFFWQNSFIGTGDRITLNDFWIYSHSKNEWKFLGGSAYYRDPGRFYDASANDTEVINDYPKSNRHGKFVFDSTNERLYFLNNQHYSEYYMADLWEIQLEEFIERSPKVIDNSIWINIAIIIGIIMISLIIIIFIIMFIIVITLFIRKGLKGKGLKGKELKELKIEETDLVKKFLDSDMLKIEYSKIELLKQVGQGGSNSYIYNALWSGQEVALKLFSTSKVVGSYTENSSEFEKEFKIISSINHPNVIRFYGYTIKSNSGLGILIEYCSHGDLRKFIAKSKKNNEIIQWKTKQRILFEISSGMEYLHDRKIIHRDLKSSNVLLTNSLQVKLIDFGLSRAIKDMSQNNKTRRIGTSYYMAPEIVGSGSYNEKVDVFSFSIICFEVLEDTIRPYGDEALDYSALELKVANNPSFRPIFEDESKYPKEVVNSVKLCWNHDPTFRLSFKELKEVFK